VARYLGPVHELWRGGANYYCHSNVDVIAHAAFSAKAKVSDLHVCPHIVRSHACWSLQGLPLPMLELVLNSDHLILASEDDTFAFIAAWAHGRPQKEQEAAFDRLWPCLRLRHMSPTFLTSVVARSKYRTRLKPWEISDAIADRSISETLGLQGLTIDATSVFNSYAPSRAPKDPAAYLLEGEASLTDCTALTGNNGTYSAILGIAGGYYVSVRIKELATVHVAVCWQGLGSNSVLSDGLGPVTRLKVCAGGKEQRLTSAVRVGSVRSWGPWQSWKDFFGKPW
jgi:hypothetical protein